MARNAHKIGPLVPAVERAAPAPAPLRLAEGGQAGFDPVGRLRFHVSKAFGASGQDRWSPLSTSVFLLAVCGTFWLLVAMALLNSRH